ncbi:hypothetical protein ACVRW4_07100 [Streptococcus phocae subsp. phocae]
MKAQSLVSHQHSWWFYCFSLREKLARSHNKRSRNSTISDSLYDMGFGAGGYYRQRLSTSEAETSEGMAREQKLEDINLEKEAQKNRDKNEGIEAGYRDAYFGSEFPVTK